MTAHQKRFLAKIERGETVSARGDWTTLLALAEIGALDVRRAPNGQLEYLLLGTPVKVGP
jgi:hypothetical protein